MNAKDSLRVEAVYFAKLRDMIRKLEVMKETGNKPEELDTLIDSCIEANGAILILYKNLGEAWNDCVSLIQEQGKKLEELKAELTGRIDGLEDTISDLSGRVTILETTIDGKADEFTPRAYLEFYTSGGGSTRLLSMKIPDFNNGTDFTFTAGTGFLSAQALTGSHYWGNAAVGMFLLHLKCGSMTTRTVDDGAILASTSVTTNLGKLLKGTTRNRSGSLFFNGMNCGQTNGVAIPYTIEAKLNNTNYDLIYHGATVSSAKQFVFSIQGTVEQYINR